MHVLLPVVLDSLGARSVACPDFSLVEDQGAFWLVDVPARILSGGAIDEAKVAALYGTGA